jgi:hypothetical protein
MLLEEIESDVHAVNSTGSAAFEKGEYEQAKKALERAEKLTKFRETVAQLSREWDDMALVEDLRAAVESGEIDLDQRPTTVRRRNAGRLQHGARTPEKLYYRPILESLVELGGSGQVADVLERVRKKMEPVLCDVDFQRLKRNPDPRWKNAAQWARNTMVNDGRLRSDSQRGVWDISEQGRRWLENEA